MSSNSTAATLVWAVDLTVDEDAEVVLEDNWSRVILFRGHVSIARGSMKKLPHHGAP